MTNKEIVDFWNENGYYNEVILSDDEVNELKEEANRLIELRGEDTRPYKHPAKDSELFEKLRKHPRVVELVELCMGSDLNREVKLDSLQTWMYFKPPGELGRDVHQNIFYSHANKHDIINSSVALVDANRENGGLYVYPGSHKEWCLPINIDEDRLLTNPDDWRNERGKPCVIPGEWVDGEWNEKYEKVYTNAKAGSVSLIHSHVIHGSEENRTTDKWRTAFLTSYLRQDAHFNPGGQMKRERTSVYE